MYSKCTWNTAYTIYSHLTHNKGIFFNTFKINEQWNTQLWLFTELDSKLAMWKYVVHSTFLLKKNYHKNLASGWCL